MVYSSAERAIDNNQDSGRSTQRQISPPSSPLPEGIVAHSPQLTQRAPNRTTQPSSSSTDAAGEYKSLSVKKHDLTRDLTTSSTSQSSHSQSIEDILIDPISMELMKKPGAVLL